MYKVVRTPLDSIFCAYMSPSLTQRVFFQNASAYNAYITYCLPHCLCLCLSLSLSTLACCENLAILKPSFIHTHAFALTHTHANANYSHQKPFQKRQNVNERVCERAPKKKNDREQFTRSELAERRVRVFGWVCLLACLRE